MITTLKQFLAEKNKVTGNAVNEDFEPAQAQEEGQPVTQPEGEEVQEENTITDKITTLAEAANELFATDEAAPVSTFMFADYDLTAEDFQENAFDFIKVLNDNNLTINASTDESIDIVKTVQTQEEETQPAQVQEEPVQEVQEQKEEVNELFGFGKKTYDLNAIKPSQEALDFINQRKDLMSTYNKFFIGKQGMSDEQAKNAVLALYDFGKGTPMLKKYTIDFNKDTNQLTVDLNGKGLFNGSPIMG